jgi:GNAT superfamily N-acetyltransferase
LANRHGLEIRAAGASDAPVLAELMAEAGRPATPAVLADALESLRRDGGAALMAQEWGPPSGLIVLHWYRPLDGARHALMSLLVVAADARRRGVARLLLKAGAQAARAAGCEALQAVIPDGGAEGLAEFCEATGFTQSGRGLVRALRRRS